MGVAIAGTMTKGLDKPGGGGEGGQASVCGSSWNPPCGNCEMQIGLCGEIQALELEVQN